MERMIKSIGIFYIFIFLVLPSSTNFKLRSYGMGSGGDASSSDNYSVESIVGEVGGDKSQGTNANVGAGLFFVQNANVPHALIFENNGDFSDQLHFILNPSNNSSDTRFAIAISDDDFATTKYIQNDLTVGDTLGIEDYQTYADWGGASGDYVIGLEAETTYKIKAKAIHGKFSESGYGPTAEAATSSSTIDFDIDVSAIDEETAPPFDVTFSDLDAGSVIPSTQKIWTDFSTNANFGGRIYIKGLNSGLNSTKTGYKIASFSGSLDSSQEGFGAQGESVSQVSGGPFFIESPYNNGSNFVGTIDSNNREIFGSDGRLVSGRGSFILKAKASSVTPAAADYNEILTIIVSANF